MSDQQRRRLVVVLAAVALAAARVATTGGGADIDQQRRYRGACHRRDRRRATGRLRHYRESALQVRTRGRVRRDGRYRFTTLPGGAYTVTFKLTGFRTVVRQALQLDAGFVATVDTRLAIGQLEETLTVSANRRSSTSAPRPWSRTSRKSPWRRSRPRALRRRRQARARRPPDGLPDVGGNQTGGERGTS